MTTLAVEPARAGATGMAASRSRTAKAAIRARRKGSTPEERLAGGSEGILTQPHHCPPPPHGPGATRPDRPAGAALAGRRRHDARMANTSTGKEGRGSKLPARTGADVHLADAFDRPGCPLCRERDRAEAAYLE